MKRILYIIYIMVATLAVTLFGGCEEQVFEYDFINNVGEEPTPTPTPTPGVNAKNVIYYTSTDGKVITPKKDAFGVSIVSNTYTNGKGTITFSGTVTKIGEEAFSYCDLLRTITIPNSVTSIGTYAFGFCSGLTSVTIPNSVTSIGISAFDNCTSLTSVTIPNSVTEIGPASFRGCTSLKSIYGKFASEDNRCLIVNGVLTAFAPAGLTSYIIPNSVTSIGTYAFYYCSGLTSVTIPNSVTSIEDNAFYDCSKLAEVYCKPTTPPTLGGPTVFDGNASDRKIYVPSASVNAYKTATNWSRYADQIVAEGSSAPSTTTNVIEYTSSDGNIVTPYGTPVFGANIVSNVYENGKGTITFDGPVTTIGEKAFYTRSTLASITIPNSVTSIGNYTFRSCTSLTSVTIPEGVTSIGYYAFEYCTSLTSVTIPNSVTSIGNYAFYNCFALTSVTIPNSVTEIGKALFSGCTSLKSIYGKFASEDNRCLIVNGVLTAFAPAGLTSYIIPNSVTSIGDDAFRYCSGLTSVTIPNSVTSIGNQAFYNCTSLTSVTIPESVTSIGDEAFSSCSKLAEVYCKPTTPPTLSGSFVFEGGPIGRKIYVPSASVNAYKTASNWSVYASQIIAEGSSTATNVIEYTSTDGAIVTPNTNADFGANIVSNVYENGKGRITFDGPVTKISSTSSATGASAFYGCNTLTSITIPESVTSIGDYAFGYCSGLTSVTIPNSVTEIGNGSFRSCTSLKSIYGKFASEDNRCLIVDGVLNSFAPAGLTSYIIPNSVTSIGNNAFYNCTSLTSVTIPNSVTSIGDHAFYYCNKLTSVTIPESVTSIGNYAFMNCSKLAEVYCKPTTPPTLGGSFVFDFNASDRKIYVPSASVNAYKAANYWSEYASQIVAEGSSTAEYVIEYTSSDGNIVTPNAKADFGANIVSNVYENGKGVITFDGPVTKISNISTTYAVSESSFYDCKTLTSITIPESVTSIRICQFVGCSSLKSFYGKFASEDNRCLIVNGELTAFAPAGLTSYIIPNDVTSIGKNVFYRCSSLTSMTIPDSVISIGDYVFDSCTKLTSVTIPESVTSIGNCAFYDCCALASVTIPNSVTSIGNTAFYNCSKLAEVYCKPTTPPTLSGSYVFDGGPTGRKIYVPSASVNAYKTATNWSEYASQIVAEGSSTTEYFIEYTSTDGAIVTPNTNADFGANIVSNIYENGKGRITFDGPVTKIASITNTNLDGAFYNCKTLKSITIPESVTLMEDYPFIGCSSLSMVNITDLSAWCRIDFANALDNPLHDVGKLHLNGSAITSLTIPSDITEIKKYAFYGYTSLTDVTIHNKVTSIGSYAFDSCGLASVTIPESVTSAESAFNGCTSLVAFYGKYATDDNRCLIINGKLISFAIGCGATSYTIPDNVTSIGKCAFSSCSSLTNIVIPNKVTSIGSSAFYDCTSLTNVTIGSGVTSIGSSAFEWCSSLTNVFIPDSVTSIGGGAFWGCKSLTSATIGSGVTTIHNQAFQACSSLSTVNITDLSAWCRIDFADSSSNPLYISEGKLYLNGSEITSLTIPSNITKIKKYTFYKCSSLTDVTIHDKVTSIGNNAFYQCASLSSVTIPNSVTSIGNTAFYNCSKLATVYCKPTTPPTLSGSYVFDGGPTDRKIYVPSASVNAYKAANYWSEYAGQIVAE